jgi:Ca-activated chloride channel homolog
MCRWSNQNVKGQGLIFFLLVVLTISAAHACYGQDTWETVRIESDLVDLKVSVLGLNPQGPALLLEKKDFQIFEDGAPQEITFFAAADAAFDLVLLLDLSGSSAHKLKMIKRSAKRFIDATRPIDRIAIVTFTDRQALLSNFTLNRSQLKQEIDGIKNAFGGTNFWDAMNYVLRDLIPQDHGLRRSAIVVMSDGVDNALEDVPGPGSRITFDELVANIRDSEAIVFPIYVDTESEKDIKRYHIPRAAYAQGRDQLGQIAAECGTTLYRASRLTDLDQLYSRVIRDLGTVYSIGYRPLNRSLDGKWRSVGVQLIGRPGLSARTKSGYYAKLQPMP